MEEKVPPAVQHTVFHDISLAADGTGFAAGEGGVLLARTAKVLKHVPKVLKHALKVHDPFARSSNISCQFLQLSSEAGLFFNYLPRVAGL